MPTDLPSNRDEAHRPGIFFRLAWVFYLVLAVAGVIWIGSSRGTIPLELFLDPERWWADLALGAAGGLALVALWDIGRRFVPAMRRLEERMAEQIGPVDASEVFALAVISGFAEEVFFRGAVQSSVGFVWATVIFTLMHTGSGRVFRWWTAFAFLAALVFGGLVLARGNLLPAIVAHVVVNAINLRRLASIQLAAEDGSPRPGLIETPVVEPSSAARGDREKTPASRAAGKDQGET